MNTHKKHWLEYIFGCAHKWGDSDKQRIFRQIDGIERTIGYILSQKCSKCGKVSSEKIYCDRW